MPTRRLRSYPRPRHPSITIPWLTLALMVLRPLVSLLFQHVHLPHALGRTTSP